MVGVCQSAGLVLFQEQAIVIFMQREVDVAAGRVFKLEVDAVAVLDFSEEEEHANGKGAIVLQNATSNI